MKIPFLKMFVCVLIVSTTIVFQSCNPGEGPSSQPEVSLNRPIGSELDVFLEFSGKWISR